MRHQQTLTDIGFLIARLAVGVVFIAHGWSDITQEGGVGANVANLRAVDVPLPDLAAPFLAYSELIGGALLAVGALTRVCGVLFVGLMLSAWGFVHKGNFFLSENGFEYVLVLASIAALFALAGGGRLSVDRFYAEWRSRSAGSVESRPSMSPS